MYDIEVIKNTFEFMFDYIKETDYDLSEKLSKFVLDGAERPEILLECAVKISFNKAYSSAAIILLNLYEYHMIENCENCYPYLLHSVRETIMRNMITVESNSSNKSLYLLQMSNKTVKIGIATDVKRRISQIKASSGMDVEKYLFTDIFKNAKEEENILHKKYKNRRKNGEFFDCDFSEVEREIIKIAKKENVDIHYFADDTH